MLQMSESTLVLHVSYKCKDTTKLCKTENSSFLCIFKKIIEKYTLKMFQNNFNTNLYNKTVSNVPSSRLRW